MSLDETDSVAYLNVGLVVEHQIGNSFIRVKDYFGECW